MIEHNKTKKNAAIKSRLRKILTTKVPGNIYLHEKLFICYEDHIIILKTYFYIFNNFKTLCF